MRKDKEQDKTLQAVLYSAAPPSKAQRDHLLTFLSNKYHAQVELIWQEQEDMDGFRIAIDADVYEWTTQSRLNHLSLRWLEALHQKGEVIPLLRDSLESWTPAPMVEQMGKVRQIFDGIVLADGLEHATYGEIVLFSDGVRGMVQSLSKKRVGCIVFGDSDEIVEGSVVRRTGKTAGIPVGNGFLGRVVDALGSPIDGGGPIAAQGYRALEHPAPGILERAPVSRPMATGVLAIDSMFPIGRGQRELIIGDRQTGKTAIAVDTILNQKDNDVVCIYVAIGQKVSTVAQLTQTLRVHGALDYTIVVCAGAGDGAPYQYIAPYAGCALGEFFMEQGRDVLIIYDDLSKHAIAYRTLSLLLGRSPGREAYPGDVFYLHSRLLERAAQLSEERGGGSMTALPIVETQAGDVSAYIPTNIISITDGQIFLESRLFFAGQRPAVNVGLSVSRVGSSAQTKAMRVASGALRLDLAQYREMEAFTQFASELDEGTTYRLEHGQRLMRLLQQEQSHPRSLFEQVVLLTAAMGHTMQKVPLDRLHDHARGMLRFIDKQDPLLREEIEGQHKLSEQSKQHIIDLANDYLWLSSKEN